MISLVAALLAAGAQATPHWTETYLAPKMAELQVPGVAVAIIEPGGDTYVGGFGLANIDAKTPVTPDTVFRVGSNSKPVTASAALLLLDQAGLSTELDLRPYFSALNIRPKLNKPLTMKHLLAHTAGFNEALFGQHSRIEDWSALKPYLQRKLPPRFIDPGEVIAYVDFHTALAGYAIEEISGSGFADFVDEALFTPLGMTSSTFLQVDLPASIETRRAKSYRIDRGEFVPYEFDAIATTPSAGLSTTANDMSRYLKWLLAGWAGALEPQHNRVIKQQLTIQARNHPALTGRAFGFAERQFNGWRVLYKDGQATGFNARLLIVPDAGIAFFIVHNANILEPAGGFSDARLLIREFTDAFLERELSITGPIGETAYTESEPVLPLNAYEGDYRTSVAARHNWEKLVANFDTVNVSEKDGQLEIAGRAAKPVGEHLFMDAGHGGLRAFRTENGKATHVFFGASTYERVPYFERPSATLVIALAFLVVFLALTVAGFWRAGRRAVGPIGVLSSVIALGFFAGFAFIMATTDPQRFFHGMTPALRVILMAPPVALTLSAGGFAVSIKNGDPKLSLAPFLVLLALCGWLYQWNLLGWNLD